MLPSSSPPVMAFEVVSGGIPPDRAEEARQPMARVAVVGGGTMGTAIATWLVRHGADVVLQTRECSAGERFRATLARDLKRQMRRGSIDAGAANGALTRGRTTTTFDGFEDREIVIEAITENLLAKRSLLATLERVCSEATVVATTTSSLMVGSLGAGLRRPERFIGMHFFNPVDRIHVVEVAPGEQTDIATRERAEALILRIGKRPLRVADRPGFLINRILFPFLLEALACVEDGTATPVVLDAACVDWGMRVGPCAIADMVGLDVLLAIHENLADELSVGIPCLGLLRAAVGRGRLGRKTGAGIFSYHRHAPDLDRDRDARAAVAPTLVAARALVIERLVFPMFREAVRCVGEGIGTREQIDDAFGEVLGWRPGPLRFGETLGVDRYREVAMRLAAAYGEHHPPRSEVVHFLTGRAATEPTTPRAPAFG